MALIRGVNSKCPCPICLVQKDEQDSFPTRVELRTALDTKTAVEKKLKTTLNEKILKKLGLRNVKVNLYIYNINTH